MSKIILTDYTEIGSELIVSTDYARVKFDLDGVTSTIDKAQTMLLINYLEAIINAGHLR